MLDNIRPDGIAIWGRGDNEQTEILLICDHQGPSTKLLTLFGSIFWAQNIFDQVRLRSLSSLSLLRRIVRVLNILRLVEIIFDTF